MNLILQTINFIGGPETELRPARTYTYRCEPVEVRQLLGLEDWGGVGWGGVGGGGRRVWRDGEERIFGKGCVSGKCERMHKKAFKSVFFAFFAFFCTTNAM